MDPTGKTEIVYSARLTEKEMGLLDRLMVLGTRTVEVVEDLIDATKTEAGLEGGKSLISTFNRMFDQIAFHHEASTRQVEASTRLNETYIDLLRKQVENQEKLAKSIEEVRKAQAGQSSAIQSLDKRLKNIEQGSPQKAPFQDGKTRPQQHHRSTKVGIATLPAAPTTSEGQNANKDQGTVVNQPAPTKENSEQKQVNNALQEQVQKLSVVSG